MRSNTINKHTRSINLRLSAAFTIIELIVVVSIIGILAAITIISYGSWKQSTITTQLKSDLNGVVAAMENARTFNDSGYPADVNSLTTFTKSSGVTLSGGSSDGGKTYCVNAVNSQFPSLTYHVDSSNTVVQSGACPASVHFNLTTIAGTGGTVNAGGTYNTGTVQTITATPNANYSFSSWTGSTGCSGVASHNVTITADMTCTANFTPTAITMPTVPTVTANTAGATTTFSWGAASCPGNTARYQYRYTISPSGFDSGIVATAATSVQFTTSTDNQTYTVATQAECYNGLTASGMSAAGSGSYYRPVPITVSGGTVSYDGAYTIRTFTSSGTLTVTNGTINGAEVLVVAGGGSGSGASASSSPPGGGAGGLLSGGENLTGTMGVVVGVGGTASTSIMGGNNGGNSSFGSRTAIGGGGGGSNNRSGLSGGSGGGGAFCSSGGAGTAGQGYAGYGPGCNSGDGSGGGGGAGGISPYSYIGGPGFSFHGVCYAGGGAAWSGTGTCGGGHGGSYPAETSVETPGINGLGGGGGGGYTGQTGGSGIVIIRYLTP